MTITTLAPALAADAPRHQPWCAEHATGPGRGANACWAEPVDVRLYPAVGNDADDDSESGHLTLLLRHAARPTGYGHPRTTEILFDRFPDGENGCGMDPDEAEITAFALLALAAEARGDSVAAGFYRSTTNDLAAVLLARRENGEAR